MGVGRAQQRNIEGWVERKRPNSASAKAARRAREREAEEQGTMDQTSPSESEQGTPE
jgi:bifunctional UDP-N-acetylglucosamine pyrophosphorylase/glucosamine-1-phosphate N-acetyltransferase